MTNEQQTLDSCNNPGMTQYNKGCRCLKCRECEAARKRKKRQCIYEHVLEFKKKGCEDCGWNKNPNAIVFHHVGEKIYIYNPNTCSKK